MRDVIVAIVWGTAVTIALTLIAFMMPSSIMQVILWQATILQFLIGGDGHGLSDYHGPPQLLFIPLAPFLLGILLGIPIYSVLFYWVFKFIDSREQAANYDDT